MKGLSCPERKKKRRVRLLTYKFRPSSLVKFHNGPISTVVQVSSRFGHPVYKRFTLTKYNSINLPIPIPKTLTPLPPLIINHTSFPCEKGIPISANNGRKQHIWCIVG